MQDCEYIGLGDVTTTSRSKTSSKGSSDLSDFNEQVTKANIAIYKGDGKGDDKEKKESKKDAKSKDDKKDEKSSKDSKSKDDKKDDKSSKDSKSKDNKSSKDSKSKDDKSSKDSKSKRNKSSSSSSSSSDSTSYSSSDGDIKRSSIQKDMVRMGYETWDVLFCIMSIFILIYILLHITFVQCTKRNERYLGTKDQKYCAYMEHEVCDERHKSKDEKDVSIIVHMIVTYLLIMMPSDWF